MAIELGNFENKVHSKDLRLTRVFKAPRKTVFAAFTQPEHLVHWWAPKPLTVSRCEVDLRPGGEWNYTFQFPDGTGHDCKAVYRAVEPPSKLVMESSVPNPQGTPYFTILQTILFEDKGDETGVVFEMKILQANAGAEPFLEGAKQGTGMTLDNLTEYLGKI